MPTEKEKMLAGELYNASDPGLVAERLRTRDLCHKLNALSPGVPASERAELLVQLLGAVTNAYVTPPFYCDYGRNIDLGSNVHFNFN